MNVSINLKSKHMEKIYKYLVRYTIIERIGFCKCQREPLKYFYP